MRMSYQRARPCRAVPLRRRLVRVVLLWFASVSAAGAAPTIDLWYGDSQRFGDPGLAQPYVNLLGRVEDPSGIAALEYSLNGAAPRSLAIGRDKKRLWSAGDFNADIPVADLLPGEDANIVVVRATASDGGVASREVIVTLEENSWPLPYAIDWGAVSELFDVVQVTDGQWSITGGGARTDEWGYDRLLAVGDPSWTSYEITVPITIHYLDEFAHIGLIAHWNGNTDDPYEGWQPKVGWNPSGAFAWYTHAIGQLQFYDYQGPGPLFGDNNVPASKPLAMAAGERWIYRMRVEAGSSSGARYRLKAWRDDGAEPADWDLDYVGPAGDPQYGGVGLLASRADVTFGDVSVTEITPVAAPTSSLVSDDFGTPPSPDLWTFVDSLGDGTLAHDASEGSVRISVPAGSSHDSWTSGDNAPRLLQVANDADFSVEVKFLSALESSWQIQGVLVEQDDRNFLRFDVYRQGDSVRVFAGSIVDLTGTYRIDRVIDYNGPFHLRIGREGSLWTLEHSPDGDAWETAGSFSQALRVTAVGLHASNYTPNPASTVAPAHTAAVDYFWNSASPGVDEEGGGCDLDDPGNTYTVLRLEWNLLSLPCKPPAGTTLAELFGDDIPGPYGDTWIVYTYSPVGGYTTVDPLGEIGVGQGFWIVYDLGPETPDVVLDLPEGSQRAPDATGSAACAAERCLAMPLERSSGQGVSWNLIGNPTNAASGVSIASLRVSEEAGACAVGNGGCTLTEVRPANVGGDFMYRYHADGFERVRPGDYVDRWDGLWYPLLVGGSGAPALHWPLP